MELKRVWVPRDKIDLLIMEQLLKDRMLLDDGRDYTWHGFKIGEKAHGFMVMDVAIVHGLQRKSSLTITLAP